VPAKKTLRNRLIHNRFVKDGRGISPAISTIIITGTLLVILVIASFVSSNILELQMASTEFEQAKTNMLLLDEVVQDVALRRGAGGYVQFNQRSGGIGITENTETIKIAGALVGEPSQQPNVTLRNSTATSGGWTTPEGAYANGTTYASILSAKPSASQIYSGYGFNIPFTATVTKVRVRVDAWAPNTLTLRPNAAGTYQAWGTFGSGSAHWDRTSDRSDLTGVQVTGSALLKETENLEDTTQTGTINSVTAYMRAFTLNWGGAKEYAKICWRIGVNDYESAAKEISRTAFTDYFDTRTINPNTGSDWTWTEINALQIGSIVSTLGDTETIRVSEYWIVVNYTPPPGQIRLQVSYGGGINWVPTTPFVQDLTTTETTYWFDVTVQTDWKPNKINNNMIQAKVDAYSQSGVVQVYLDWIPIEVTYVPFGEIIYESPNLISLVYRGGSRVSGSNITLRGDNSLIVNMTNALSYLRVETGQGIQIKLDYHRVRIIEMGTLLVNGTLHNFIEITFLRLVRDGWGGSGTVNVKVQNIEINTRYIRTYDGGNVTIQLQLGLNPPEGHLCPSKAGVSKTVVMFTEISVQVSTA